MQVSLREPSLAPKTKDIRVYFSSYDPVALTPLSVDGCNISVLPDTKLLGLIISKDLKWTLHVDYIRKKAAKRLYAMHTIIKEILHSTEQVSASV